MPFFWDIWKLLNPKQVFGKNILQKISEHGLSLKRRPWSTGRPASPLISTGFRHEVLKNYIKKILFPFSVIQVFWNEVIEKWKFWKISIYYSKCLKISDFVE